MPLLVSLAADFRDVTQRSPDKKLLQGERCMTSRKTVAGETISLLAYFFHSFQWPNIMTISVYENLNQHSLLLFVISSNSGRSIFSGYRIYSNKRRGPYLNFRATSAALIRGRCLFEGGAYLNIVPDKFTF